MILYIYSRASRFAAAILVLKAFADTAKRLWPFVQVSRIPLAWLRMIQICDVCNFVNAMFSAM